MTAQYPPYALASASHGAELFRRATAFKIPTTGGVRGNADLKVTQNGTPNMSVIVPAGEVYIPGTSTTYQGQYYGLNDGSVTLALSASDPTNPRIDLVAAVVQDSSYAGAANQWVLQIITGTPAASPTIPALPASSIAIAQIAVAASVSSIVNANITDRRLLCGDGWSTGDYKFSATSAVTLGWLYCNGAAVSRTTYANLFAVIGTTYGAGDGSTTFNLPDFRGRVPAGYGAVATNAQPTITVGGTTANGVAGEAAHALVTGELASHNHTFTTGTESATHTHTTDPSSAISHSSTQGMTAAGLSSQALYSSTTTSTESANHTHSGTTATNGSGTAHNNIQPILGVNVLIRT
jgi:microcystin-dependent protein